MIAINFYDLPHQGTDKPDTVFVFDPLIGAAKSPVSHKHFSLFSEKLKQLKFSSENSLMISAAPPLSLELWKDKKRLSEYLKQHREKLHNVLLTTKPKLIVAFGASAASQVTGRAVAITKVRGTPNDLDTYRCIYLPTLSPAYVSIVPQHLPTLLSDLDTAARIKSDKFKIIEQKKIATDYKWCDDIGFLLKNPPKLISLDTETVGVFWYRNPKLLSAQITTETGISYVIPYDYEKSPFGKLSDKKKLKIRNQLKKLLTNPKVRCFGHNFKFDWQMIKTCLGFNIARYYDDTIVMVHEVDENTMNKNLDDSIKRFVPEMAGYNDELNTDPEHENKTRMDLLSPDKFLKYAGGDSDATFRLRKVLRSILKKDRKAFNRYRRVSVPALRAFCDMEREGYDIDTDALRNLYEVISKKQKEEKHDLLKMIHKDIIDKHKDTGVGIKLTRADLLIDVLFEHKKGFRLKPVVFTKAKKKDGTKRPSVSSKQHLPYFKDDNEFVRRLIDYIKNDRLANTFVGQENKDGIPTGLWKYIKNGKIRPSYQLHIVDTGRTSSVEPNGQNFPKRGMYAKAYRRIFVAPTGWSILEADYSQLELRIMAVVSGDVVMLATYRAGGDIHALTASKVMRISIEKFNELDKELRSLQRYRAKAINFGYLYGMWWRKFIAYARTEYGITYSDKEAENTRKIFFDLYKGVGTYHKKIIAFAHKHGYVRTLTGKKRHLASLKSEEEYIVGHAERQGINSPIQGAGSDFGLIASALIRKQVPRSILIPKGFVHDSHVSRINDNHAFEAICMVKDIMENIPIKEWFDIDFKIPLTAELSIGKNLADGIELPSAIFSMSNLKTTEDILTAVANLR